MDGKAVTEIPIGNTLFVVRAECSPNATETVDEKLERMILRRISDTKSYQRKGEKQLAMCLRQSEHGTDN